VTDSIEPGALSSQTGVVVFLTGLSGSGKSTIAEALAADLEAAGEPVSILDGDELRRHLSADLGFDRASREANVQRAAEIAADRAGEGQIVVTALISPFDRSRRMAREVVEQRAPFLLVWVRTPLEVAESRDPKGLYARARAGEIPDFTGIDSPYEEPEDADLVIETVSTPVADAVARIREAVDRARSADRGSTGVARSDASSLDGEEADPLT
jgi:sulfate adenylyltransferase